jgi:hypothetical protein
MMRFVTVFLVGAMLDVKATALSNRAKFIGTSDCDFHCRCPSLYATNSDDQDFANLYNRREDLKSNAFLQWMYHKKDCQGEEDAVQIQTSQDGLRRGVYAARPITQGEHLFAVPFESTILIEEEETTDVERGFKWIQIQTELQQQQDWKPYLDMLPSREQSMFFDATPDFWSNDQIQALEIPQFIEQIMRKKQSIQRKAQNHGMDVSELQFATWLINSRAVTLVDNPDNEDLDDELISDYLYDDGNDEIDESVEEFDDNNEEGVVGSSIKTTCVLIPFLDMINHSSENFNTVFSVMSDRGDDAYNDDNAEEKLYYAAVANRHIAEGEEVLISYGTLADTSLELLLHYGFVPDKNPYDEDFMEWSGVGDKICNCWSTSLQEDQQKLAALEEVAKWNNSVERTILKFRIRMKKAYNEYRISIDDSLLDPSSTPG